MFSGVLFIFTVHVATSLQNKGAETVAEILGWPMVIALQGMTSVNKLNFIPEYREYLGLGNLWTNPTLL